MKKHFISIFFCFAIISCTDDVKFNNPSFQSVKDTVFWRAISYNATLSTSGILTIKAYTRNEIVTLKTNSNAVNTYVLGTGTSNTATYEITNKTATILFSTGSGFGDGEIIITEYDAVNETISGTFRFNVDNSSNNPLYGSSVNFQNGFFYKIPLD